MLKIEQTHTRKTRKKYDRISFIYDLFNGPIEHKLMNHRKNILGSLRGRILDIGIGSGKHLQYYSPKAEIVGIDISERMLAKAAARLKNDHRHCYLIPMRAEKITF